MDECVRFGSPMGRRMDGESRREDDDAEVGRRGVWLLYLEAIQQYSY